MSALNWSRRMLVSDRVSRVCELSSSADARAERP